MKIGELIDVSEKKEYLKSFNKETKQIIKSKILGIIKKQDSQEYKVYSSKASGLNNTYLFSASPEHLLFVRSKEKKDYDWVTLKEIYNNCKDAFTKIGVLKSYIALDSSNKEIAINISLSNKTIPIVDVQMENGCYFSEGILSHNTGGNALKFYASQRLEVIRTGNLKVGEMISGNTTKVKVVKNKVAPPKREALFNIVFGKGIDTDSEIIELAKEDKIIKQSGSWFKYQNNSIAQGIASAIMWLNENPDIKESIYKEILANRGLE